MCKTKIEMNKRLNRTEKKTNMPHSIYSQDNNIFL